MEYTNIFKLLLWITILLFSSIIQDRYVIFKNKKDKIKTVIIIVFIYFIIYLLLGLAFGFKKSPYALTFNSIASNLFLIVVVNLIKEFIRTKLLINNNSFFSYAIITILYVFLNLDFTNLSSNFETLDKSFQFMLGVLFPSIVSSCLLTYLSLVGGYTLNLSYTLPFALFTVLLPVFPDLDWFLSTSLLIIAYVAIFLFINHENQKANLIHHTEVSSPLTTIPLIFFLLLFISFVAGFFVYRPIAIISNSMVPEFSRGDIVICKNVSNIDTVKIGDIIEYEFNDTYIIHRVVSITEDIDGNLLFTTKGDNNSSADQNFVTPSQIIGVVKFSIPYLGYPTVLFTELLVTLQNK